MVVLIVVCSTCTSLLVFVCGCRSLASEVKAKAEDSERCIKWELDLKQKISDFTAKAKTELKMEMKATSSKLQSPKPKEKKSRGRSKSTSSDNRKGRKSKGKGRDRSKSPPKKVGGD